MPELPEVETVRNQLEAEIRNDTQRHTALDTESSYSSVCYSSR